MQFAWKAALIREIETAAEGRAELALADPDDAQIEKSQRALFDLAEQLRALPSDHATFKALFREETELSNPMRATVGEPERRHRDAKEDLLAACGIHHERFDNVADVVVRQANEVRVRRHRLFELIDDLSRIARDDAETHERPVVSRDRVPDLRLELIDVLMLALHKVSQITNSDGCMPIPAAPGILSKMFSQEVRL